MHQRKMYGTLGRMVATLLMQEGPPLNIFPQGIVDYIVSGSVENVQPQDSTDGHVRVALDMVSFVCVEA